jgi:hypothetical protein
MEGIGMEDWNNGGMYLRSPNTPIFQHFILPKSKSGLGILLHRFPCQPLDEKSIQKT